MDIFDRVKYIIAFIFALIVAPIAVADEPIEYEATVSGLVGSGDFAPYYISSLQNGRFTQSRTFQTEVSVVKKMDTGNKFSYGFGVDLIGGGASSVDYRRYDGETQSWIYHSERPSSFWIQQLYGELKYRCLFMEIGLKERKSTLLNQNLTSGDLVKSGNTRPMPQIRGGFVDFQDIPSTNGSLQVFGELLFGYMADNDWIENHYNYYGNHIALDQLYNYKCIYFRTKPSQAFSVVFGMQASAIFGGRTYQYYDGNLKSLNHHHSSLKYFLKMVFPVQDGGEGFYSGSHLGSWDIRLRYRLKNQDQIFAYTSWLWEDGSGIAKLNGFDGLWGLEYKSARNGLVNGALVEYFDFTNQSGPIHFNSGDTYGCNLPGHASGADDYYNNATYNSYAYYGMSLGTPVMMSPIYNLNGNTRFVANAVRGFHIGIEGSLSPSVDYRIKGGWRKAWGTSKVMFKTPKDLTAVMVESSWRPSSLKGLAIKGQIELDRGNLPANAFGVLIGVSYNGFFK